MRSPHAHAGIRGINTDVAHAAAGRARGVHARRPCADADGRASAAAVPHRSTAARMSRHSCWPKDEVAFRRRSGRRRDRAVARHRRGCGRAGRCRLRAVAGHLRLPRGAAPGRAARPSRANRAISSSNFASLTAISQAAFARAPHRARVSLKQHRGGAHSMEGRGAVAVYDANEDRLTLWSSTQLAHEVRAFLMRLLRLDENRLRVVAPDVGGGFGAKFVLYPEEVVVAAACVAAAPSDQMGRGSPRAFLCGRAGARPILGSRSSVRRRRQACSACAAN